VKNKAQNNEKLTERTSASVPSQVTLTNTVDARAVFRALDIALLHIARFTSPASFAATRSVHAHSVILLAGRSTDRCGRGRCKAAAQIFVSGIWSMAMVVICFRGRISLDLWDRKISIAHENWWQMTCDIVVL